MPRFNTLADWLAWQETLHPHQIELGLERVASVADRLQLRQPDFTVVTVAGTNGKGSSVAMLESVLLAAGYQTGAYTSPHLQRYNERIRINGQEIDDVSLCSAFAAVDSARGSVSLSYFEFGTLAALLLFKQRSPDIVLLEVGLGGRLDAVNILDCDVALITSIDIDHSAWLGTDRESIGLEKAGILRAARPAICSDADVPDSIEKKARELNASWYCLGADYHYQHTGASWSWRGASSAMEDLPLPALLGQHQLDNAAGVLMVLEVLAGKFPVTREVFEQGLQAVKLDGRCQIFRGAVELVYDVAHNTASARRLARILHDNPASGVTFLVLGMLDDKDVEQFTGALNDAIDCWYLVTPGSDRGLPAASLRARMCCLPADSKVHSFPDTATALRQAESDARDGDRIVVTGSFVTVAEALESHV
jgi:dihydrofolate synthase/folylpolyglutamate synthase